MSRKDAVILASRVLGVLLTVWALAEASYLPERVLMLLHYTKEIARHMQTGTGGATRSSRWDFCLSGSPASLMSRWLLKGGSEIEELLFPAVQENPGSN